MSDSVQQELGRTTPFAASSLPGRPVKANVPAANLTYAYAGFGAVLGVLFGVATAVTLHQNGQATQVQAIQTRSAQVKTIVEPPMVISEDASVVQAGYAAPEEKDMGVVSFRSSGLRGHLTTSWSERLSYHFTVAPSDPSQLEAFAQTVSDPPRPLSIDLQMKSAAGQVLCDQQVVLKYDPRKKIGLAPAQLDRLEALEIDREHAGDVFENNLGKDGKVESISSQGTIPCSKQDYDATASWAFSPQFPDLREQVQLLKHSTAPLAEAKVTAPKAPVAPALTAPRRDTLEAKLSAAPRPILVAKAVPAVKIAAPAQLAAKASVQRLAPVLPASTDASAEVQAPAPFHFQIEGDDEIVDFDATQKSLETSAGKTFFVTETLAASNVAGWLDEQANVHYRCDETSSCTLSLSSAATVLHATMRSHRAIFAQVVAPDAVTPFGSGEPVGLNSLGR